MTKVMGSKFRVFEQRNIKTKHFTIKRKMYFRRSRKVHRNSVKNDTLQKHISRDTEWRKFQLHI